MLDAFWADITRACNKVRRPASNSPYAFVESLFAVQQSDAVIMSHDGTESQAATIGVHDKEVQERRKLKKITAQKLVKNYRTSSSYYSGGARQEKEVIPEYLHSRITSLVQPH